MTLQRGFASVPHVFSRRTVQPGAPLGAVFDAELAVNTEAIAFTQNLNVRHYYFNGNTLTDTAMQSHQTTVNTDQIMTTGSGSWATALAQTVEIPWYSHPNVTKIEAYCYIAVGSFDLRLLLSMESDTLIDAVGSVVQSDRVPVPIAGSMPTGDWSRRRFYETTAGKWNMGFAKLTLAPSYPASRRIALRFKTYWQAVADPAASTGVTTDRVASMMYMRIADVMDPPSPES